MAETPIIIIDNGGCTIKAGLSGEDYPAVVVPNAIGLEDFSNLSDKATFEKYIDANSGDFKVRYPIRHGAVTDWESMTTVWSHIVEDHLNVNPEECSVLVTEPISNPKPAREKMAEILFETLNFKGVSIATSPILPMYAAGLTTGLVLDIGDGATQVVPVWGGLSHKIKFSKVKEFTFCDCDIKYFTDFRLSNNGGDATNRLWRKRYYRFTQ